MSEQDIKQVLSTDNGSTVLGVRRLRRRVLSDGTDSQTPTNGDTSSAPFNFVNTASVVVTFSGSSLPRRVSIYYSFRYPELYVQPVIQCHKCLRYGHINKMCVGKVRCPACAEEHGIQNCPNKDHPKCLYCKGLHLTNESGTPLSKRSCEEFAKQRKIKEMMAVYNISTYEAAQLTHDSNRTNNPLIRLNDKQTFPSIGESENIFVRNPNSLNNYNKAVSDNPKRNFRFTKQLHKPAISNTPKRRNDLPSELLFYKNGRLPDSYSKRTCFVQEPFDAVSYQSQESVGNPNNDSSNNTTTSSLPSSSATMTTCYSPVSKSSCNIAHDHHIRQNVQ